MSESIQSKGGKAAAKNMTPQQRRERSLKGALNRWHKQEDRPPFAKYQGFLCLGGTEVDCYVLNTEDRVLSSSGTVKAIANKNNTLREIIGI